MIRMIRMILLALFVTLMFPCTAAAAEDGALSYSAEIAVYSISRESWVRSCGQIASLDELGPDEYLTYRLTVTNTSQKDLASQHLQVSVDGSEKWNWPALTIPAGQSLNFHVYYSNMQHCMLEGAHTVNWFKNGVKVHTQSFSFTTAMQWQKVYDIPTYASIRQANREAAARSPYLAAWTELPGSQRYTQYCVDFKADHLPRGTYLCLANMYMDLTPLEKQYRNVRLKDGPSFYAGVQFTEDKKIAIMSFWDVLYEDANGTTHTLHARKVHPDSTIVSQPFTGEGDGMQTLVDYEWLADRWYRMLLRCIESGETNTTHVEMWIRDLYTGQWTHLCTYDTGIRGTAFRGPGCIFLENYLTAHAGEVRSCEFANIRIYDPAKGRWLPVTSVNMNARGGMIPMGYQGSYAYGSRGDRFYMITSGAGDWLDTRKLPAAERFSVQSVQEAAPY